MPMKILGSCRPFRIACCTKYKTTFLMQSTTSRHQLTQADIQDGSIHINACYTIAREVESLYNYLVYLVDKRKETLSRATL